MYNFLSMLKTVLLSIIFTETMLHGLNFTMLNFHFFQIFIFLFIFLSFPC